MLDVHGNFRIKVTHLKSNRSNLNSLWTEKETESERVGCDANTRVLLYSVSSHLPANYTAYYSSALYRSPKSDWIMGAQSRPMTEQLCLAVTATENIISLPLPRLCLTLFHPLCFSFLIVCLCISPRQSDFKTTLWLVFFLYLLFQFSTSLSSLICLIWFWMKLVNSHAVSSCISHVKQLPFNTVVLSDIQLSNTGKKNNFSIH